MSPVYNDRGRTTPVGQTRSPDIAVCPESPGRSRRDELPSEQPTAGMSPLFAFCDLVASQGRMVTFSQWSRLPPAPASPPPPPKASARPWGKRQPQRVKSSWGMKITSEMPFGH